MVLYEIQDPGLRKVYYVVILIYLAFWIKDEEYITEVLIISLYRTIYSQDKTKYGLQAVKYITDYWKLLGLKLSYYIIQQ